MLFCPTTTRKHAPQKAPYDAITARIETRRITVPLLRCAVPCPSVVELVGGDSTIDTTYMSKQRGFAIERAGAVWIAHKRKTRVIGKTPGPAVTKTGVVGGSDGEVGGCHVLRRVVRARKSAPFKYKYEYSTRILYMHVCRSGGGMLHRLRTHV